MRQRRKPSPNLPGYKKVLLDALAQGLRLVDLRAIWSTWDAPYCDPLTVRQLWYEVKYRKKYATGGKGRLPVGHLSSPRSQEHRDKIKAAVRSGISFADFWASASDWPRRDHQEKYRVSSLFAYYKHRLVVHTTAAIEAPKRLSYGKERRLRAVAAIAKGVKFAEFWTTQGAAWNVPMFRLRNWYHCLQKQWRDLVAVYPEAAHDELVPALAARAAVHEPRWVAEKLRNE